MVVITDKHDCCGCGACVQACPHSCISMHADKEGFLYPESDPGKCVNCNLCEKVCPVDYADAVEIHTPQRTFVSCSTNDDIRKNGSSGGMFQTIAEYVIGLGGVVFGARFDKQWNVIHDYTDNICGIQDFCGSKYIQSKIGECFKQARSFLDEGRTVLFSGTPCQIHGLKKYLRKEYDNLLTIDFVCHGVPSPAVWHSYLNYTANRNGISTEHISGISFRDKRTGWKKYSLTIRKQDGIVESLPFMKNSYMNLFLKDLILRPSCYTCKFKNGTNVSDITLGDFWGVSDICPEQDDDRGLSIVLINSFKGNEIISKLESIKIQSLDFQQCIHKNPSYIGAAKELPDRIPFWHIFEHKGYEGALSFLRSIQPSGFSQLKYKIKIFLRSLLHKSAV